MNLNGMQFVGDGYPGLHPEAQISEAAHIQDGVEIGARTKVWQFASVIRNARIGEDCSIADCAIIDGSRLGDRCIVSHGTFIDPGMYIGDDVFIGPLVVMCNDFWPRVDKDGFDMQALIRGAFITTKVEDGVSIGASVVILPGIVIGAGSMIAAGAVVDKDVPPLHLYKRDGGMVPIDPARQIKRMRRAA